MGVIAIIYESRPNVTSDAAALALKAGSACVLRGGKEAHRSAAAIVARPEGRALAAAGLPEDALQLVEDTSRASANELMTASGYVDLLIPGGAGPDPGLRGQRHRSGDRDGHRHLPHLCGPMGRPGGWPWTSLENAKCSRPSVCNAAEVCLVDRKIAGEFLPKLKARLVDGRAAAGQPPVELRLDETAAAVIDGAPAGSGTLTPSSWTISWRSGWWTVWRGLWLTSPPTPPATRSASSPATRRLPMPSSGRWTPPPCTGTPPPALPTAGSSAWAVKWASPPRSSTPGARWAWRSCAPSSLSFGERSDPVKNFSPFLACVFCAVRIIIETEPDRPMFFWMLAPRGRTAELCIIFQLLPFDRKD